MKCSTVATALPLRSSSRGARSEKRNQSCQTPANRPGPVLRHISLDVIYALESVLPFCWSDPQATVVAKRFPDKVAVTVQLKLDVHFVV